LRKFATAAALAVLGALATVGPPGQVVSTASAAGGDNLRVASFNVLGVSAGTTGSLKSWKERRSAVVATIMGDKPDVLGVQEVNPSSYWKSRLVSGDNQYFDLRNGLNRAGGNYKLTNAYAFNCVNASTMNKCVRKYRGASGAQRILYNADRVSLVSQGSVKYAKQAGTKDPRYMAWAVLKLKSNGSRFLFVNTHLANDPESVLVAQWKQLTSWVKDHAHGRPVVVVGDFNTSKWNSTAKEMLPAMKRAGFGDVLNQEYRVLRPDPPRARSIAEAGWLWSYNEGSKDVRKYSYHDARDVPGKGIDWIFATNSLRVQEYEVVLRFDRRTLQVQGNLPSDHNMVEADLLLP
jgi:endonuclease/exonuclease/phosphatase family metal-dependent hydrolase